MSREIKFRAWDDETRIMLNPMVNDLVIHLDGTQNSFDYDGDLRGTEYTRQLKLMQFTGLCDKNGKNIYEGDIIRYSTDSFGQKGTFTYSVIFTQGQLRTEGSTLWAVHLVCEVIGNIYENPELLGESHES